MGKRINWIKMNQIKCEYEGEIAAFREQLAKYGDDFRNKSGVKELRTLEHDVRAAIASISSHRQIVVLRIESDGYDLPKTMGPYFVEKDKEAEFLRGEMTALLSRICSKIKDYEHEDFEKKGEDDELPLFHNPCPNITVFERARRVFSVSNYKLVKVVFFVVVALVLVSFASFVSEKARIASQCFDVDIGVEEIEEYPTP